MHRKIAVLAGRVAVHGVEVENFGLVDNAQTAWAALPKVKAVDLDLLFVDLATGNTNTHGRFGRNVRMFLCEWVREGPTHHFALGVGHHADTLVKLADCLGIEAVVVRRHEA